MPEPITWLVDISHWQGNIDVARIAREGYAACVCKATEGTTYTDPTFARNTAAAKKARMIPGAYHYLRDGDGAAQARHFHRQVSRQGGPSGWLIQLDCEADGYGPEMTAWAKEWRRLTNGHPFLIYSGAWWWPRTRGFRGAGLTPHLWASRYVSGTDTGSKLYQRVPDSWWRPGYGGWEQATILQFSSTGKVAGKRIDVNAFRGTRQQLAALTVTPNKPKPPPTPPAPAFPGRELRYVKGHAIMRGADVRQWQQRMRDRGWRIDVDGEFGPRSAAVAEAFQREKGLHVDGIVGPNTWRAAWTAPKT